MAEFEEKYIHPFTDYEQVRSYEDSLKYYRDLKNSLDTAKQEGREEGIGQGIEQGREQGREERAMEIAKSALDKGLSVEDVMDLTGLSKVQVEQLSNRAR